MSGRHIPQRRLQDREPAPAAVDQFQRVDRHGHRHLLPSISFGGLIGMLTGTFTVRDACAVSTVLAPPPLLDYGTKVDRTFVLAPLAVRGWSSIVWLWSNHRNGVLAIAIFSPLAYILVLNAVTFTSVVHGARLTEASVLIGVLLGSLLLGERNLRRRPGWGSVILAGVAMLATAQAAQFQYLAYRNCRSFRYTLHNRQCPIRRRYR